MRLATIAWRGLLARPLRTALAVIGVALGVAVVAATVITTASSDAALRSATADLLGAADVRLRAFAEMASGPRRSGAARHARDRRGGARVGTAAHRAHRIPARTRRCSRCWHRDRPGRRRQPSRAAPHGRCPALDVTARPTRWLPPRGRRATGSSSGISFVSTGGARGCRRCASSASWPTPDSPRSSGARCSSCRATTLDESFLVPAPIRYVDLDLGETGVRKPLRP